jgi:integrase
MTDQIDIAMINEIARERFGAFDVACPFCGPTKRKLASQCKKVLRIWRVEPGVATFHCARCGEHGFARDGSSTTRLNVAAIARTRAEAAERERITAAERLAKARWLWSKRKPIGGSIAEVYLRQARRQTGQIPATLGYSGSEGFHTWSVEEVEQFEERHPIGTKARLALGLLLYTGQRRSDVIRLGKQHARGGKLTFTQHKGRNRKPHRLTLPILPVLQRIIDATPCGDLTYLVNDWGRPFTDGSFGNKFRDWCDQAGLHCCSAHGLRKAGATIAANNGATARQLMAIFGWDTIKQAEHYTRKADQQKLAEAAMHLLEKR